MSEAVDLDLVLVVPVVSAAPEPGEYPRAPLLFVSKEDVP